MCFLAVYYRYIFSSCIQDHGFGPSSCFPRELLVEVWKPSIIAPNPFIPADRIILLREQRACIVVWHILYLAFKEFGKAAAGPVYNGTCLVHTRFHFNAVIRKRELDTHAWGSL